MHNRRIAAALALPLLALSLPGCSAMGDTYVPSHRASAIAAMDVETLGATVSMPQPLPSGARDALGEGTLGWYAARALAENPVMRAAYFGMSSGSAEADRARAERGPRLGLEGRIGGTDSNGQETYRRDSAAGATASMTLFDGGAGRLREGAARWRAAGAAAQAWDRAESVALGVAQAWIGVLKGRSQAALADAEVRRFEALLSQVRRLAEGGGMNVADVPEAEARLERIRQQRVSIRQALADAEAAFLRLTGESASGVPAVARPPSPDAPGDEEALAASASHPSARAYEAQVRAAVKGALSVDAERFGSLVAQVGPAGFAQAFGGANVAALGAAFFRLQIPVFDSGERSARLRRAAADLEVAVAQQEDAQRVVALGVRQASNARRAAGDVVRLAERERDAAGRLSRAKEADYKAANTDLRSLLDAEQTFMEARMRADAAAWDRALASYRMLAASGLLAERLSAISRRDVDLGSPEPFDMPSRLLD